MKEKERILRLVAPSVNPELYELIENYFDNLLLKDGTRVMVLSAADEYGEDIPGWQITDRFTGKNLSNISPNPEELEEYSRNINNILNYILQIVVEDVPHKYQGRLLPLLKFKEESK
jgi:hypothetical protein